MACTNTDEWIASGDAQLAAAGISGVAYTQARLTLLLSNPYQQQPAPAYTGPINKDLPYFIAGEQGCPQLVIPPAAESSATVTTAPTTQVIKSAPLSLAPEIELANFPGLVPPASGATPSPAPVTVPAGSPCPEGFVSSEQTTAQLTEQVQAQLGIGASSSQLEAGGCKPQIVLAPQFMVTKDDFLVVDIDSIYTAQGLSTGTVPIVMTARLMTCDGKINNMQTNLDVTHTLDGGAARAQICMPLTDGYLIAVAVTGAPNCTQPGEVWLQGVVRFGSCSGSASIPLFAGYLTDEGFVGWPGGPQTTWGQGNGAVHASDMGTSFVPPPTWYPEDGAKTRITQVVMDLTTSATAGNRMPMFEWYPPVPSGTIQISSTVSQPASKHYLWVWGFGLEPGLMNGGYNASGGPDFDGIVQVPISPDLVGNLDGSLSIEIKNADHAGDTINKCTVIYEAWVEPPPQPYP